MKKAIIGIGLVFVAVAALAFTTATKDKAPQAVKDAFAKKFPTAKKVDWEKILNSKCYKIICIFPERKIHKTRVGGFFKISKTICVKI